MSKETVYDYQALWITAGQENEELQSRLTAAEKRVEESKSLEGDYIAQVKSKTAIGKVWLRRIKKLEGALEKIVQHAQNIQKNALVKINDVATEALKAK